MRGWVRRDEVSGGLTKTLYGLWAGGVPETCTEGEKEVQWDRLSRQNLTFWGCEGWGMDDLKREIVNNGRLYGMLNE